MPSPTQKPTFFNDLEQEIESLELDEDLKDEILVKDENGQFKIFKGGKLVNLEPFRGAREEVLPTVSTRPEIKKFIKIPDKPLADFYFSFEDKKEIDELKDKSFKSSSHSYDFKKIAKEIIKKSNLFLKDEILKQRFENIIISFLRDIRDELETKGAFYRSIERGGMGLDEKMVDEVVKRMKEEKSQLSKYKKKEINPEEVVKDVFRLEGEAGVEKSKEDIPPKSFLGQEKKKFLSPPPPAVIVPKDDSVPLETKVKLSKAKSALAPLSQPKESPATPFKRSVDSETKVKIEDIKFVPHLVSPMEELKRLNLTDFRRLSHDPRGAILKIKAKLDLLEEESFEKRIIGIKAWQQSEVFGLYQKLGQESMARDQAVGEVIKMKVKQNQPTLSSEEFEAVMELNKSLRF